MATSYIQNKNSLQGMTGDLPARAADGKPDVNVGKLERQVSLVGGGALALYGLVRRTPAGIALAALGGDLIYRGVTGHSIVYDKLGVNTASIGQGGSKIKVAQSFIINKSPEELYRFWRNFENLPHFMEHLESVKTTGDNTSHWVAKAPAGMKVEWDAAIINEKENELIAWKSQEGADVPNAGSVQFAKVAGDRGTKVTVELDYNPPAGKAGAAFAKLFGEEPSQQVREDLRHFKQMMETGEIPTTKGQPSCRG